MIENISTNWSSPELHNWTSQYDRDAEINRINTLLHQDPSEFSDDEQLRIREEVKKLDEAHGALRHIERTGYVERHGMVGYASIIKGDILSQWEGSRERLLKALESKSGRGNISSASIQ